MICLVSLYHGVHFPRIVALFSMMLRATKTLLERLACIAQQATLILISLRMFLHKLKKIVSGDNCCDLLKHMKCVSADEQRSERFEFDTSSALTIRASPSHHDQLLTPLWTITTFPKGIVRDK